MTLKSSQTGSAAVGASLVLSIVSIVLVVAVLWQRERGPAPKPPHDPKHHGLKHDPSQPEHHEHEGSKPGATENETKLHQVEELREALVHLQQHMADAHASREARRSSAVAWVYYKTASEIEEQVPDQLGVVDYYILANFAYSHTDLDTGDQFVAKAESLVKSKKSSATVALALGALGHLNFEHYPKTELTKARKLYEQAVEEAQKLEDRPRVFVVSSIYQEWALDEYSVGNEKEGDAQAEKAAEAMEAGFITDHYRGLWKAQLDASVVQAKVRGGLL